MLKNIDILRYIDTQFHKKANFNNKDNFVRLLTT